jgi:hypothetical protein
MWRDCESIMTKQGLALICLLVKFEWISYRVLDVSEDLPCPVVLLLWAKVADSQFP